MPITTVRKSKGSQTCAKCNGNVAKGASACQNCGSTNLKKVLIVIKKSESVPDAPGEEAPEIPDDDTSEDDEEVTDEDIEDEDGDSDEEDDDESDDEDEEDEEGDEEKKPLAKSVLPAVANDIAAMVLTLGTSLIAASEGSNAIAKMDEELTVFNTALDDAMVMWADGDSISKAAPSAARKKQIMARLKQLKAKAAMLQGGDSGGDDMSKRIIRKSTGGTEDIYKGLHPEVVKQLKAGQELAEEKALSKYVGVAKSLGQEGDATEIAKTLKFLAENNKPGYDEIVKQLKSSQELAKASSIFTQFGKASTGTTGSKADSIAKSLRANDKDLTQEQAVAMAYEQNPDLYDEAVSS